MKRSIATWSTILVPAVILAVYIGQQMTSETAALAMGMVIGIMLFAVGVLVTFLVRDERRRRARAEAMRPAPRTTYYGSPYIKPRTTDYIDVEWREVSPAPHAPRAAPQIEAPSRALTIRRG